MCNPPQNIENGALTEYQLQKINELRQELGEKLLEETPLYDDQFSLLRWLQGWNFKCEEIVPRFKRASSAFRCMGINSLPLIDDVDELNDYVRSLVPTADYSPGGVLGFDRDGNIVGFQMFGNCHFKQLAKCGRNSDAYRLGIVETALVYKLLINQERKFGRKLGIYGIADVGDCNSEHLAAFPQFRPMMQKMQELFPDILHKGCTINTHPLVRTAFGMVKRWLPEQSRDKIVLLGTDYHPHLVADIGEENLFVRLGGTKKPVRGHPEFGTLRLGGMPPDTMTYSAASNPLHIEEEALSKLVVPARQKREIEIDGPYELDENGIYLLQWFWHCQSDIGFAVLDENGEELWPHLHLYTDRVPEYGIVEVGAGKKFKLMFDNSFSIFSRKEVKFGFKLKKKSDE